MPARFAQRFPRGQALGAGSFARVVRVGEAQGFPKEMAAKVVVSHFGLGFGLCV